MKKLITLLVAAVLVFSMSATAFAADASVTYEGGAEKFVFIPGSEWTDTDLFNDNFKGVMPGDTVTQDIIIRNRYKGVDHVLIFMRAELHDEEGNPLSESVALHEDTVSMYDFLSKLSMTVKRGDKVLFEATADHLGGLENNVCIGSFKYGYYSTLTVELHVPIELGNEYANRVGEVDWVFTAEEIPDTEGPDTGDNSQVILWGGLMLAAAAVCIVVIVTGRKKRSAE